MTRFLFAFLSGFETHRPCLVDEERDAEMTGNFLRDRPGSPDLPRQTCVCVCTMYKGTFLLHSSLHTAPKYLDTLCKVLPSIGTYLLSR